MSLSQAVVYGLVVHSSVRISTSSAIDKQRLPDVVINACGPDGPADIPAGLKESCRSTSTTPDNRPHLVVSTSPDGNLYRLEYANDMTFWVDHHKGEILFHCRGPESGEELADFVYGPVLSFMAGLKGSLLVHAAAVEIDGKAILVAGASGAGKSTAAASFALRGYRVFTDDVAVINEYNGSWRVEPGYARIGLWRSSLNVLGQTQLASEIKPDPSGKYYMDFMDAGCAWASQPAPVDAIYFIERREGGVASARFGNCSPAERLINLAKNQFHYRLRPEQMRPADLKAFARMAEEIWARAIILPDDVTCMKGLPDAILDDYRTIRGSTARKSLSGAANV